MEKNSPLRKRFLCITRKYCGCTSSVVADAAAELARRKAKTESRRGLVPRQGPALLPRRAALARINRPLAQDS
jgi:hypothetical protein